MTPLEANPETANAPNPSRPTTEDVAHLRKRLGEPGAFRMDDEQVIARILDLLPTGEAKDPLEGAREAFLNMVADAKKWEFETDGDENGCWSTVTMVSDHSQVQELCDALGMVGPYDEFTEDRIARYVAMPPAPSIAGEGR